MVTVLAFNNFGYYNNGSLTVSVVMPTEKAYGALIIKADWATQVVSSKVETTIRFKDSKELSLRSDQVEKWFNTMVSGAANAVELSVIKSVVLLQLTKV